MPAGGFAARLTPLTHRALRMDGQQSGFQRAAFLNIACRGDRGGQSHPALVRLALAAARSVLTASTRVTGYLFDPMNPTRYEQVIGFRGRARYASSTPSGERGVGPACAMSGIHTHDINESQASLRLGGVGCDRVQRYQTKTRRLKKKKKKKRHRTTWGH